MTVEAVSTIELVQSRLPHGAELLTGEGGRKPLVITADLNNDGRREIVFVYRLHDSLHIQVLKYDRGAWIDAGDAAGTGYQATVLRTDRLFRADRRQIIVGWQVGAIWSELAIYDWADESRLVKLIPDGTSFSRIEVEDMPSINGERDGLAEIALWAHDTGEAYKVEVYRLAHGTLQPAYDVYPYYFRKVVRYYEELVRKYPTYTFYRSYLQDALSKAGLTGGTAVGASAQSPDDAAEGTAQPRSEGLFRAAVKTVRGTKWGYIDAQGRMRIPAQFAYAFDYQDNGLAVVEWQGKNGIIDRNGRYVVRPVYESIDPFSDGRAIVTDQEGFKVIDEQGRVVTSQPYGYISRYAEGRAAATHLGDTDKYGYLDVQGREVIPFQYEEAGDFHDGKAVVKIRDGQYALIDKNGRTLHIYSYPFVGDLGDGLLPFQQQSNGKYGYIDEQGKVAIALQFTAALPFHEGRAVVNIAEDYHNKYGLINRQGAYVLKPQYNQIMELGEGRYAVGFALNPQQPYIGSKYAIADADGRWLTEARFLQVDPYSHGFASVYDEQNTYFVDLGGKRAPGLPVVPGSGTLTWMKPLIQANVDQRISYLTPSGQVVWKPDPVIPLRWPYRVIEHKYKPNKDYLVYYPQVDRMNDPAAEQRVNERLKQLSRVVPVGAGQLDYSYTGDFNVTFFKKNLLVLELDGYRYPFGAAHGMPSRVYAHIDLETGQLYTLKDLFKDGSPYGRTLSEIVGGQIRNDPQYSYVFPGSYKGISPDQPFYVTDEALHLYFEPYEIAPYVAGFPTFTIPFAQIMDMIAQEKPFWQSFH